jgi:hypothetical protein
MGVLKRILRPDRHLRGILSRVVVQVHDAPLPFGPGLAATKKAARLLGGAFTKQNPPYTDPKNTTLDGLGARKRFPAQLRWNLVGL